MSATTSSSDKLLFLFTTDSDDLSVVKSALQDYYKFPAANTIEATGCNNFVSSFKTVIETLRGADPNPFVNTYKVPDPSGLTPNTEPKTLTLVVVISGNADSNGLYDNMGGTQLTWAQINQTLNGTIPNPTPKSYSYLDYSDIHVVFATPFCNSFLSEWDLNSTISNGTLMIPQTAADLITQAERETFLLNFANELKLGTSTMLDSFGRISFNDIASSLHGASVGTYFRSAGSGIGGKYFPGYSFMEIQDGNPEWWESPDIWINTPGNDFYNIGSNWIYINVRSAGTHPIKEFWIGVKVFWSGLGPAETLKIEHLSAGGILPSVLKGGEGYLYSYNVTFTTNTHRCLVARAKFTEIFEAAIDDYSEWSIVANADEAQRNIDPAPVPPPAPAPPLPDPGNGQNPDPDPEPDEEDQNNTGDRSLRNIRGVREHVYSVLNTFRGKRRFRVALHKEFSRNSETVRFSFFRINGKKLEPLEVETKPYPHIPLILDSGEKADLLFYMGVSPKARLEKELKLPLEILVEMKGKRPVNFRRSQFMKMDEGFAPAGGITIKIYRKAFSVHGHVFDRKGGPVPGARVFIRTANGRQAAVLKTDEKGGYHIPDINPDAYRMYAVTKSWTSEYKTVNLFTRDLDIDFIEGIK